MPIHNQKKFKETVLPIFGDNAYLKEQIETGQLTGKLLTQIVELYNRGVTAETAPE